MSLKIKELLKSLFPDKASDIEKADIEEKNNNDRSSFDDQNSTVEEMKQLVKTQHAEISKLVSELTAVKEKETANQKLLEDKAKKEKSDLIESLIKKSIDEMKIPAKNEELIKHYKAILEKDYEAGKIILDSLPGNNTKNEKDGQQNNNDKKTESSNVKIAAGNQNLLKTILERNEIHDN